MSEGDRILAELVRFIREVEREDKRSAQVKPSEAFEGQWLARWEKLVKRAEKYLANRPN